MRYAIAVYCVLLILVVGCTSSGPAVEPVVLDIAEIARQTMAAQMTPTSVLSNPSHTDTPSLISTPVWTDEPLTEHGLAAGPAADQVECISQAALIQVGLVTRVIDGTTIEVSLDGKDTCVRYIGVEIPLRLNAQIPLETVAEAENRQMVSGQIVTLIKDFSEGNPDGCLRRYVFLSDLSGVFLNHEMARRGYAVPVDSPPDLACQSFFEQASELAQGEKLGMWMPPLTDTPTFTPSPTQTPGTTFVIPPPPDEADQDMIYCDCK